MNTTKESPIVPPSVLFMILSVLISSIPLVIGVLILTANPCHAIIRFLSTAVVLGFCWYAVRYSSLFIPYVWVFGSIIAVAVVVLIIFLSCI